MKIAIYPGVFDPLHKGHISIVEKSIKIFDRLIVLVSNNPEKVNSSNIDDRYKNVKQKLSLFKNVEVIKNENKLTAHFANENNINFIVIKKINIYSRFL